MTYNPDFMDMQLFDVEYLKRDNTRHSYNGTPIGNRMRSIE